MGSLEGGLRCIAELVVFGFVILLLSDKFVIQHLRQDILLAVFGFFGAGSERGIIRGSLRQAGQKSGFRQRQVGG